MKKHLENRRNVGLPNLPFHRSHEILPSVSQSLISAGQQLPLTNLQMHRSRSYDNGHHINSINLKRYLSQAHSDKNLDNNDAKLITKLADSANNLENSTPPQDKVNMYSRSQELSGLSSSSFQESCIIAEEEDNVGDVPLPNDCHPVRSKSQPLNIYSVYENTSNSNYDRHGITVHRSLTQMENDSSNPLSASYATGIDDDGSLPASFDSQFLRLWSSKPNDVDNSCTDNQASFANYLILDPLTSGDPLQGVHHDSTPIKVTKIIPSSNQSKPQELTKIGNINQNQSNRTENKNKLFTSESFSDETNLDDIFSPNRVNDPDNNQSKFQFETSEIIDYDFQNKNITNNNPPSQSSGILTENTGSVSAMDNKPSFDETDSPSSTLRKEGKFLLIYA